MAMKREYGKEQPYIPLGIFKVRIPFVHYRWEWPEGIQGFLMLAVPFSATAVHMEALGCSFEVAMAMVAINGILYMLHPTFGDPLFPGWITPCIPLTLAYLSNYEPGPDRIYATIALQLLMAVLFLFMGISGLAQKIMSFVPLSIRAGILMGAGIAATYSVVRPGEAARMYGMEKSVIVGAIGCFIVLYSVKFAAAKSKNKILNLIGKFGMLPGMILAFVVGFATGEIATPEIQWGIMDLNFGEMLNYTVFTRGFPAASYFINALPLMVTAYIIAFGDFVLAETVTNDADVARPDEYVEFNPNRSNIISGVRNLILGLIAPYAPLSGPLWAGGTIAAAERYKQDTSMESIYGGVGSYIMGMAVAGLLLPMVSLLRPGLPIGMSLTMLVQGFGCGYISINMCKTREEQGVCAIMAIAIAFQSAAIGLLTGIIMHLVIGVPKAAAANKEAAQEVDA